MPEEGLRPGMRSIRQIHLPSKALDMMAGDIRIVDDISTRGLLLLDIDRLNPDMVKSLGRGWIVVAMPAETVG